MSFRLLVKLAFLPIKRSWFLMGLMILSFAQVMLALWFMGSIQKELNHTKDYARFAKFVTVQMKDESVSIDPVKEALSGVDVTFEELRTEDILKKMETEEADLVQVVRAVGSEGLQLTPKVLIARGNIPDDGIEKVKLMTEVYRLDATPVHHARLLSFYDHLGFEIRIAMTLIFLLIFVQLLVFFRIQYRDSSEIARNLSAWGVGEFLARMPGCASIVLLSVLSTSISIVEWFIFRAFVWKNSAFLGELSLEHTLSFPGLMVFGTFVLVAIVAITVSFSGRTKALS